MHNKLRVEILDALVDQQAVVQTGSNHAHSLSRLSIPLSFSHVPATLLCTIYHEAKVP